MAAARLRNGKPALGVFDEGEKDDLEDDDDLDDAHVAESIREASVVDDEASLAGKDLVCRTLEFKSLPEDAPSSSPYTARIKPLHVSDTMKKNIVNYIQRKRKQEAEAAEQRTAMKKKKEDAEEKVRNAKKELELSDEELKRLNQKIETMQKQHHEMTSHYKTLFNKLNEREKLQKQKAAAEAAARAEADSRKTAEVQAAHVAQAQAQAAQISAALEAQARRASPFPNPAAAAAAASMANKGLHAFDPNLLLQLYASAARGNPLLNFPGMIPNTNPTTQP